jgi:hypothetical protein
VTYSVSVTSGAFPVTDFANTHFYKDVPKLHFAHADSYVRCGMTIKHNVNHN